MKITPLEIYQQEFKKAIRGVDPDEVEEFLVKVAESYEEVLKENEQLARQVDSLSSQLDAAGKPGQAAVSSESIRRERDRIILDAKREAENLIQNARKQSEVIVNRAQKEAQKLQPAAKAAPSQTQRERSESDADSSLRALKDEALELRREISWLKGQRERFLLEYRELLEKHLRALTAERKE